MFDWTAIAIEAGKKAEEKAAATQRESEIQKRQIAELRSQLEELTKAKSDHETELLEQMRQMLNTKKLKIREQQRLLGVAQLKPADGMFCVPLSKSVTDVTNSDAAWRVSST